jgi:hypothetical protein
MNQIQNIEKSPLLKDSNDGQSKAQATTEAVSDNLLIEPIEELSRIPFVSSENINEKEDLLKDIEIFKEEEKKQSNSDSKLINKKRKRANPKFYSNKNDKIDKSTTIELMPYKKKKNIINTNTPFELEYCYKKLNKMISKYSFEKISEILIRMNNDIDIEEDESEKELLKKIKKITSIIKQKQDITLMILRIMSKQNMEFFEECRSNIDKKGEDEAKWTEKSKNKKSKDYKEYNIKKEIKEEVKKENVLEENEDNIIEKNDNKEKSQKSIVFKDHYHNDGAHIYCYKPRKIKKSSSRCSLYCDFKKDGKICKAKCIVYTNSNYVDFSGNHDHNGVSKKYFYEMYPCLENTAWQDIQVIVENGKDVMKCQC